MKEIEVYADTKSHRPCTGPHCGVPLLWAEVVKSGKRMCFTGDPVPLRTRHEDGRLIEALDFDANHWAACPDAKWFKRAKVD